MEIDTILSICTLAGMACTVIGAAIKYGADQQKLKSKNDAQDQEWAATKKEWNTQKEMVLQKIDQAQRDCIAQGEVLRQRLQYQEDKLLEETARNLKQHEEFYTTQKTVIAIQVVLDQIKTGIDDIKKRLDKLDG